MNDYKFNVLENVKKNYNDSGFKMNLAKKTNKTGRIPNNKYYDKNKICRRIRNKKITNSQFPKLTKSSRVFNGGRRKKTKRRSFR
jgi:hypothetical protein